MSHVIRVNRKLSQLAQRLWDLDSDRLEYGVQYAVDLQNKAAKGHYEDECERPLFKFVDEDALNSKPIYETFMTLLGNYIADTRVAEQLTREKLMEENQFIEECIKHELMQECFQFLVQEGKVNDDVQDFKNLILHLWFEFYSRSEKDPIKDSSAFEHCFAGEVKRKHDILGFHNWIQYYLLEKKGVCNYYGYIPDLCEFDGDVPIMLAMQFRKDKCMKALGGFLTGVSPCFELALYTCIFMCGSQKTKLQFANMEIVFNLYKMERDGEKVLATLFPSKEKDCEDHPDHHHTDRDDNNNDNDEDNV